MMVGAYLIGGLSATLVTWATAPSSLLLVIRFAVAALALGAVFARRSRLAGLVAQGVWARVLLMGAFDAGTMLLYFVAIRGTGVAIATFFLFTQPVWVALLAPRLLGIDTERAVRAAIALALAGLVIILLPSLSGSGMNASVLGLIAGLGAGVCYAGNALVVKGLSRQLESASMVLAQVTLDCLFLLPLALWQTLGAGYSLTGRDLLVGVVLGLLCTALAYTLWMEGMARVRVQHAAVLGFLVPVVAPVYAFVLLGQSIALWTVVGGALILAAGMLVVLRGEPELESELPV